MANNNTLTERQKREISYHEEHAKLHQDLLKKEFSYEIIESKKRKWWNQYWEMYTYLCSQELTEKKVCVVGCGFGEDAIYLSKAGADVKAFDLSPESLSIAEEQCKKEGVIADFKNMAAENLIYPDDYFDIVVARDILHHVDIPTTLNEIVRVSKPGAIFFFNEVYSHSFLQRIRNSIFIDKWLYSKMVNFVYSGNKPYITEDERKLTEKDIRLLTAVLEKPEICKYFNFLVGRIIPDKYPILSKADRVALSILKPISHVLGSRVLIGGSFKK